jgi:16S rRNA G1207 methylase RsmC
VARRSPPSDPLLRPPLHLRQHGVGVELVAAHGVFSATAVDPGTAFLLRWLASDPRSASWARVLDVGCGYGPLALWLAAAGEARTVEAVDRDAVAVVCTADGAQRNGCADRVRVAGSLGYDDVAGSGFDLVVSNVPAKVGPAALAHLLLDARFHLDPAGCVAIVVVDRLAATVRALLDGDPAVEVLDRHANRGYATWTYRFVGDPAGADPTPGFARGVYRRGTATFRAAGLEWTATTSFTLGEFDTLGHGTVATAELLARSPVPGPVAVVGVGQGHLALAARAAAGGQVPLRLVDRDLLALRTAAQNLGGPESGADARHVARPAGSLAGCASALVTLPDKQPVTVTAALLAPALAELGEGAPVVAHGRAADVARVLEALPRAGVTPVVRAKRTRSGHAAARFTVVPPA